MRFAHPPCLASDASLYRREKALSSWRRSCEYHPGRLTRRSSETGLYLDRTRGEYRWAQSRARQTHFSHLDRKRPAECCCRNPLSARPLPENQATPVHAPRSWPPPRGAARHVASHRFVLRAIAHWSSREADNHSPNHVQRFGRSRDRGGCHLILHAEPAQAKFLQRYRANQLKWLSCHVCNGQRVPGHHLNFLPVRPDNGS